MKKGENLQLLSEFQNLAIVSKYFKYKRFLGREGGAILGLARSAVLAWYGPEYLIHKHL
jgi:hypothetical protein